MKLIAPDAMCELQEKADEFDTMMTVVKKYGCNNIQELEEYLQNNIMKESKAVNEVNDVSDYDNCYFDGKVCLGFDIQGDDLPDIARQVGELGEKYALQKVKDYFLSKGYQISTEMTYGISMEKQEENGIQKATIEYFETQNYHQAGYDIKVTLQFNSLLIKVSLTHSTLNFPLLNLIALSYILSS